MIKFKNGSEIHIINTNNPVKSSNNKRWIIGKPTLKDIIADFLLRFKKTLNKRRFLSNRNGG